MLNFVLIILIFLEIFGLYYAIQKLIEFDKKIRHLSEVVKEKGKIINEMHLKIQKTIHQVNTVISILRRIKNSRIWKAKRIISTAISVIELILILNSFNFEKGIRFNLKNVKKLLFAKFSKVLIKKFFSTFAFTC